MNTFLHQTSSSLNIKREKASQWDPTNQHILILIRRNSSSIMNFMFINQKIWFEKRGWREQGEKRRSASKNIIISPMMKMKTGRTKKRSRRDEKNDAIFREREREKDDERWIVPLPQPFIWFFFSIHSLTRPNHHHSRVASCKNPFTDRIITPRSPLHPLSPYQQQENNHVGTLYADLLLRFQHECS